MYGQQAIYLTPLYFSEVGLAERLKMLSSALPSRLSDLPPAFVTLDAQLSPQQVSAIQTALSHPLSVLTGGPGTGKTTALRALIAVLDSAGKRYALASPTGRAARRLSEATGSSASTIHRLLGFAPGKGFKHNLENPLPVDLVVIDEASMLDLSLAYSLLKAIQPGTHLLLVGDVDQLPSVGAGDVLRDVIASDIAPLTRLSVIFRQAAGSQIITNAHRINQGQMPLFPKVARSHAVLRATRMPARRMAGISSSSRPRRRKKPPGGCWMWSASASRAGSGCTRATRSRCWRPCTAGRWGWMPSTRLCRAH